MESKKFSLEVPANIPVGAIKIQSGQSIVIVGANGSGKTRLGTWIEFQSSQKSLVHRISAQKSLTIPESSTTTSREYAEAALYFGHADNNQPLEANLSQNSHYKIAHRWRQKPNTHLLVDFDKLMVYLFTDRFEQSNTYLEEAKCNLQKVTPPETKLDIIKRIWELILPHREFQIKPGKIETHLKGNASNFYNASEMSDGERVIFYLIGQCLSAPQNGIIIIDEPELHLHKSIQTKLWRETQSARPDCLFVYMTHDVDFAASLTEAKKIWLKSYDGKVWEWEEIAPIEDLPEELLIEVLGSRRPTLFVEGTNSSNDAALFREIYSNFNVIPRESCLQVIQTTRALRQAEQFHHVKAHGIIDRDRLNPNQIDNLTREGIKVLDVAEIENLFCLPDVLRLIAAHQALPVEEKLEEAKAFVFKALQNEFDTQVSLHVANEIKFKLDGFDIKQKGLEALKSELKKCTQNVEIEELYKNTLDQFEKVVEEQDYEGALKLFNRKGLPAQLSSIFGINDLVSHVLRMVRSDKSEAWIQAFKKYLPEFDSL